MRQSVGLRLTWDMSRRVFGRVRPSITFKSLLFYLLLLLTAGCTSLPVQQPTTTNPLHHYFLEIALGSEFGSHQSRIKKWNRDIDVRVKGQPTQDDIQTLKQVMSELSTLTRLQIRLTAREGADIEIYFVPKSEFSQIEKHYKLGNAGFFWSWWNPLTNEIYRARILISTTGLTQQERNHLIYEELTQSLGLMKDSNRYADSIFYRPWSRITSFSEMDKAVIELLYHQAIRLGMNRKKVIKVLEETGAYLR